MRNLWLQRRWKLKFELRDPKPESFEPGAVVVVRKGPYSVEFTSLLTELNDVSNKDASIEMLQLVVADLEHGGKRGVWYYFGGPMPAPTLRLTILEKAMILKIIRAFRRGENPFVKV